MVQHFLWDLSTHVWYNTSSGILVHMYGGPRENYLTTMTVIILDKAHTPRVLDSFHVDWTLQASSSFTQMNAPHAQICSPHIPKGENGQQSQLLSHASQAYFSLPSASPSQNTSDPLSLIRVLLTPNSHVAKTSYMQKVWYEDDNCKWLFLHSRCNCLLQFFCCTGTHGYWNPL